MSNAVWRFERTVQETVEALRDIIQRDDDTKASQVRGEWAYRAQLLLEPAGWDALWRLPKETCQKFGVRFPLVVYVTVEGLELENSESGLTASLQVVGVQDEAVHLPERLGEVPLEQLWPLRAQPNSAMHIRPTAQFIDLYRHFYTLIWMAWDLDSDEECGWFERNVPLRCSLWAGALARSPASPSPAALRALREEAALLASRIRAMEMELPSDAEDNSLDCSGEQMSELVMLHSRLHHVRSQWEALQNPAMRTTSPVEENLPPKNIIVWLGGSSNSLMSHLKMCTDWLPGDNAVVHVSPSLASALQDCPPPASRIILCPGLHHIPDDTRIGDDYTIASVEGSTTLACLEQRTTSLATQGNTALVGLTLDVAKCSTALAVRGGALDARSCRLLAPAARSQHVQAAVVYSGSQLLMKDCIIDGFFTGIVAHAGSKVVLEDCTVSGCGVGLQVYSGSQVSLVRCKFKDYAEAAIRYETSSISASEGGGSNLLHRYGDVKLTDCKFFSNGVNEVFIARLDENACPEWEGDVAILNN